MENPRVFPVPSLCKNTNAAALFQSLKRRGNKVSKTHKLQPIAVYEGDADVNRNVYRPASLLLQINIDSITLCVPICKNLPP